MRPVMTLIAVFVALACGSRGSDPKPSSRADALHNACPTALAGGVGLVALQALTEKGYGNWCGEHASGGKDAQHLEAPIDCWDDACRAHDYAYGRVEDEVVSCHSVTWARDLPDTRCTTTADETLCKAWDACRKKQVAAARTWMVPSDGAEPICKASGKSATFCRWWHAYICEPEVCPCQSSTDEDCPAAKFTVPEANCGVRMPPNEPAFASSEAALHACCADYAEEDRPDACDTDASSSMCPTEGCPLALKRAGTAFHAGQLVLDHLGAFCGGGTTDEVQFGVEVECRTVARPEGSTVVIDALVANGTAAQFKGWEGDCVPVAGNPQQASVTLDGPKTCTAVFDCPDSLPVWSPNHGWLSDPVPRCEPREMKRTGCANNLGPTALDVPEQFASRDPDLTPEVPEAIRAWWDSGQHCLFACPADPDATAAAIAALNKGWGAADPWFQFTETHRLCCIISCP